MINYQKKMILLVLLLSILSTYAQRNFFPLMGEKTLFKCSCEKSIKLKSFDFVFWVSDSPTSLNGVQMFPCFLGKRTNMKDTSGYLFFTNDRDLLFASKIYYYVDSVSKEEESRICSGLQPIISSFGPLNLFGDICSPRLFMSFNSQKNLRYNYVSNIGEFIVSHFCRRVFLKKDDFFDEKTFLFEYRLSNLPFDHRLSSEKFSDLFISLMKVDIDYGIQEIELQNFQGVKFTCKKNNQQ